MGRGIGGSGVGGVGMWGRGWRWLGGGGWLSVKCIRLGLVFGGWKMSASVLRSNLSFDSNEG